MKTIDQHMTNLYSCGGLLHIDPCNSYDKICRVTSVVTEGQTLFVYSVKDIPVLIYQHNDSIDSLLHQALYSAESVYSTTVTKDCQTSDDNDVIGGQRMYQRAKLIR